MLLAPTFQSAWLVGAQRWWPVEIGHRREIGTHDTLGDWCDAFADIPDVALLGFATATTTRKRNKEYSGRGCGAS